MNRSFVYGFASGASAVVVALCLWVGPSTRQGASGYFVQIPELKNMDAHARSQRLLVNGHIKEGSIVRRGNITTFVLAEHNGSEPGEQLTVIYKGSDLPDTFQDRAEALARGVLGDDGVFRADQVQARWG